MAHESNHDRYRKNQTKASQGGPDYRATSYSKGDVTRQRGSEVTKYRLGLVLIEVAAEHGNDSPEYAAALKAWKNAQA